MHIVLGELRVCDVPQIVQIVTLGRDDVNSVAELQLSSVATYRRPIHITR